METAIGAMGLMVCGSFFAAGGTFFLKLAAPNMCFSLRKLVGNIRLISGLFFYSISVILALIAFRYGELSVLYPFMALQYVWTNVLSRKYLKEKIGFRKWAGIALIFIGVGLVGIGA